VGIPKGKRPPVTPRYRWVDNIKMVLGERELGVMDWTVLPQDRVKWWTLVKAVMYFRVP
jgi:hypothetical protein